MQLTLKKSWGVIKEGISSWNDDKAPRLGASLAFYTVFSISPLFIIVLAIARLWFQGDSAEDELFAQVKAMVGEEGGDALRSLVSQPESKKSGVLATIVAGVTLIFGATTVFAQLQDALNSIWKVKPKPGQGVRGFLQKRLLSFALILAIGFLLLVTLVLSAGLSALGKTLQGPGSELDMVWQILNMIISFAVITILLAMIFKIMPDADIKWSDVWGGAAVTALLFTLGKFFIGLYLGRSSVTSAYGAAGSVIVVLLWVYYSSQIVFFGAEITRIYAQKYGSHAGPSKNAVAITECEAVPDHPKRRSRAAAHH